MSKSTSQIGMTAVECRNELRKLVEYLRGEGYADYGWRGDEAGWSPVETAIRAMRELSAIKKAKP